MMRARPFQLALVIALGVPASLPAQAPGPLEQKVRGLFENNCFRCHSHKAGKSKGGLMLDAAASMRKGGANGPAVVPGSPEKSLLIKAVCYQDEDLQMPPAGKLADEQI